MNYLVPDMDDICINDGPQSNGMNWLFYLKGKYPNFKCTLFVIPGRSTVEWMDMLNSFDWIELGMHGWNHDEEEEITQDMLDAWKYSGLYKGPNWKVTKKEMDLLFENLFDVAVKKLSSHPVTQWSLEDKSRVVHGHCWIESDWIKLESKIDKDTQFLTISEALWQN